VTLRLRPVMAAPRLPLPLRQAQQLLGLAMVIRRRVEAAPP
jgi:hypothetical protein